MDINELNKMLDLKPAGNAPLAGGPAPKPNQPAQGVASPTALKLDKWDLAKGQEVHQRSPFAETLDPLAYADLFAAAFTGEPTLVEKCSDQRRHEFLKTLMESGDYQSLHESTRWHELASEMAATEFGTSFLTLTQEDKKRKKPKPGDQKGQEQAQQQSDMACLRAVGRALREATNKVEELERTEGALGCGPGQGTNGKLDTKALAAAFGRVKDSERLRRIMALAGRYRMTAQGRQRQKAKHGYEDLVGVKLGNELDHLLPEELAALVDDNLGLDAARRLLEGEMLTHHYEGRESVGRGSIIVCVDESGSMSGEPVCNAKAFALAMAWVARHQKRYCCLVGYSGGREGTRCVLKPGAWDEQKLLDWLEHFYSGGTTMDVPLKQLPKVYWPEIGAPKGKTDLVIITDCIVSVPTQLRDDFLAWKAAEQVKTYTMIIGANDAGDLAAVSDEVFCTSQITAEAAGVTAAFSI